MWTMEYSPTSIVNLAPLNPLAKFRAAVKMALVMQRLVEFLINKKKERKKKRKKGEILDFICKLN